MAPRKIVTPDVLGILPLQDAVLFPNTVIPLAVIKRPGIALVEEAISAASVRSARFRRC